MTYQRIAIGSGSEAEDEAHGLGHDLVDDEKEESGNEHHDENHRRGDGRLLARRPSHARHFLPHLAKELYWTRLSHDIRLRTTLYGTVGAGFQTVYALAGVEGLEPP